MNKSKSNIESYFSIGEMAKLHNISIETLRHYDRQNLLKPDYINPKTGYRYYSMKSFFKMDIIKKCKAIGFSLEEIKETMKNYDSIESILGILENQKEIVNKKLEVLNNIKQNIQNIQNEINESLGIGINKIFIKHQQERQMIKYDYCGRYTKEFELKLRESLLEVEEVEDNYNHKIVFSASYKDLIENNKLTYLKTMISLDKIVNLDKKAITLPSGNYLTMYFEDDFYNTKKYYEEIIKYIKENNIEVIGDFHEIYIMTRANPEGEIMALAKIEILLKN